MIILPTSDSSVAYGEPSQAVPLESASPKPQLRARFSIRRPPSACVKLCLFAAMSCCATGFLEAAEEQAALIVAIGAGGSPEYAGQFHAWADRWQSAANVAEMAYQEIGRQPPGDTSDRDRLKELLRSEWKPSPAPLWLVLIGHGTFYQDLAKFNLRGADVSAHELADWLPPLDRPLIVINCSSSSGPFINRLSGSRRVLVTATKSGTELNFARFGDHLSRALTDPAADLDHDYTVSLLEAFLSASAAVARFYEQESRLATEHALLDDNGDALGTPATFFRGIRAVQSAADGAGHDGGGAHGFQLMRSPQTIVLSLEQTARRDELEREIEQLRQAKSEMGEDAYYQALEPLLVEIARLYDKSEQGDTGP